MNMIGARRVVLAAPRYGPNLIPNGTFDTLGAIVPYGATPGWAVAGGVAECSATAGGMRWLSWAVDLLIPGLLYEVAVDVVCSAGTVGLDISGEAFNTSASGRQVWLATPTIATFQFYATGAFVGSLDNITLRRKFY